MQIPYFEEINDELACAGQPSAAQFQELADEGYEIVFNLAMDNSIGYLENEKQLVESAGMRYIHLPVNWGEPQIYDVLKYFAMLGGLRGKRVLTHCTLNATSSCFVYMYRRFILKHDEKQARHTMARYTRLTPAWIDIIDQASALH
ncbi:MAG: protein tyrosine phosphatase family protein [Pseudomonadota bacterium]